MLIFTILNQDNYLLWKSQVLPVLRGYDFVGFIDDIFFPPPPTINTNGVASLNPTYDK
jgi:hypothetical protein